MKAIILASSLLVGTSAHALYSPNDAIKAALSEELTYVGSFTPNYSESQKYPTCVYRGKTVLIAVDYCVDKIVSAAGVVIHSKNDDLGRVAIYAESKPDTDVTKKKRKDYYDITWSVASRPSGSGFDFEMSASEYKKYAEKSAVALAATCRASLSARASCDPQFAQTGGDWLNDATEFWKEPGNDWYKLLKKLKTKAP
ncbi:MAG: hypothetical protein V4760_05970 [Bdellovibrionota bacterium]